MNFFVIMLTVLYVLTSLCIMVYGLHCYFMITLFLGRQKSCRQQIAAEIEEFYRLTPDNELPLVTVQLPIYNEAEVVERLLRSAVELDYPKDRYEIQVLDDSTDDTYLLSQRLAQELNTSLGVAVSVIHRSDRSGFKAGALAHGMEVAKGDYLAIFDADFLIPKHFLKHSIALLHPHPTIACLQGRWGHLNQKENWLTEAQSIGIDGHFVAEQGARSYHSLCMNFNGTAGIWRKQAILDGGGWQADTLTEDLDLSYRVQMKGYTIRYDFDLECPAEVPNNVIALKSQQKRWAKGSIETARKLLPQIWATPQFSLVKKLEATLHLTHYSVSAFMMLLCCLTLPMLLWTPLPKWHWAMGAIIFMIFLSAIAPCVMYTGCGFVLRHGFFSLSRFPAMLVLGTGLCLNNAWAVWEGLRGRKSEFVRTPKSGSTGTQKKVGRYKADNNLVLGIAEILIGLYCVYTFVVYLQAHKYVFGFFIAAYAVGFISFGWLTLKAKLAGFTRRAAA